MAGDRQCCAVVWKKFLVRLSRGVSVDDFGSGAGSAGDRVAATAGHHFAGEHWRDCAGGAGGGIFAGADGVRCGHCLHCDDAWGADALCGGDALHIGDHQRVFVVRAGENDFVEIGGGRICNGGGAGHCVRGDRARLVMVRGAQWVEVHLEHRRRYFCGEIRALAYSSVK